MVIVVAATSGCEDQAIDILKVVKISRSKYITYLLTLK